MTRTGKLSISKNEKLISVGSDAQILTKKTLLTHIMIYVSFTKGERHMLCIPLLDFKAMEGT